MAAPIGGRAWGYAYCLNNNCLPRILHRLFYERMRLYGHGTALYCTQSNILNPETALTTQGKVQRINKAMQAYLARAEEHDKMIAEHTAEFELGKRHLARMMDADPENFSQEDIDTAIEYLLPSGLFSRRARPKMKPPEHVFPKRKDAEFDMTGRPYHYLFYTGLPNYYDLMQQIGHKLEKLEMEETELTPEARQSAKQMKLSLEGTEWISVASLQRMCIEKLSDKQHLRFVTLMERLVDHLLAYREKDFIMQYRVSLVRSQQTQLIPKPVFDEATGRHYVTTRGKRKKSKATVKVWENGTGKISINKKEITYFKSMSEREQIMTPLVFVNKLGHVDFEGQVEGGGCSSQAGALRLALSLGLAAFEDKNVQEKMRQAGLLTIDPRTKERKKPGQRGAREKKTWKKR